MKYRFLLPFFFAAMALAGTAPSASAQTFSDKACEADCYSQKGTFRFGGSCVYSDETNVGSCTTVDSKIYTCCIVAADTCKGQGGTCLAPSVCDEADPTTQSGAKYDRLTPSCAAESPDLVCCKPSPPKGAPTTASTDKIHEGARYSYEPPLGNLTVNQIVARIIQTVLPVIGALFMAMFIYGGFQWVTAGGEEKKVVSARKTLTSAVIGMMIIVLAYVLVFNVISLLGTVLFGGPRT